MDPETKKCIKCQVDFDLEVDDLSFYKKIGVPAPTHCPECRLQRRMLFRNERDYYRRQCDLCNQNIVAVYPKEFKTPVYCVKCWWSDNWSAKDYSRDYDPNRSFIEQFEELFYSVPMIAMQNDNGIGSVNCEYTYDFAFSKNCYLVMCNWETENAAYSFHVDQSKDVIDCYYANHSELCYEVLNGQGCHSCRNCVLSINCTDCILGFDLRGCTDCIMCVGLRNKKYCILNEQYTKEEYEKKKKELGLDNRDKFNKLKEEFQEFSLKFPRRYANVFKSPGSTGEGIYNCKNSKDCFYFKQLEDSRYMVAGDEGKETYDCNNTGRPNFCYESVTPDNSYGCISTVYCWKCNKAEYSNNCHSSSNILGCSGIRHSEYMILNKAYSKAEYSNLRHQIIEKMKKDGEWGEFFPTSMSPHAYNESPAQDWVPLTESEAKAQGFRWLSKQKRDYKITLKPEDVPLTIEGVDDSILKETIGCLDKGECEEKCTVAFKLVHQELQFYRRMNIPIPNLCHNCRYYKRLKQRNLPKLYKRKCHCAGEKSDNEVYLNTSKSHQPHESNDHCPNEFLTTYEPGWKDIVYCKECYEAEIL